MSRKQKRKLMSFGRGYGPAKAAGETARYKAKKQALSALDAAKECGLSGMDNRTELPEMIWDYPRWRFAGQETMQ